MTRAAQIASALREVRDRIADAAARAGRSADSVRLIAVSKKMPPEDVAAALAAGQEDFGENYAQELRDKRAAVATVLAAEQVQVGANATAAPPVGLLLPRWHYLGPIQSNKVKYLAGQVALIHSVDNGDVLAELDHRLASTAAPMMMGTIDPQPCLVQVNIAGETRKGGVPPHRLAALLDRFAVSSHATCLGLMLIPPATDTVEATRRHFAALRELAAREAAVVRPNVSLSELSMGMSGDYVEAVAEGATMVRVGTAIFGNRARARDDDGPALG
ncbi:MAG: YggS family pyridoxal phosphate enzyme [Myxococcales bacterium]